MAAFPPVRIEHGLESVHKRGSSVKGRLVASPNEELPNLESDDATRGSLQKVLQSLKVFGEPRRMSKSGESSPAETPKRKISFKHRLFGSARSAENNNSDPEILEESQVELLMIEDRLAPLASPETELAETASEAAEEKKWMMVTERKKSIFNLEEGSEFDSDEEEEEQVSVENEEKADHGSKSGVMVIAKSETVINTIINQCMTVKGNAVRQLLLTHSHQTIAPADPYGAKEEKDTCSSQLPIPVTRNPRQPPAALQIHLPQLCLEPPTPILPPRNDISTLDPSLPTPSFPSSSNLATSTTTVSSSAVPSSACKPQHLFLLLSTKTKTTATTEQQHKFSPPDHKPLPPSPLDVAVDKFSASMSVDQPSRTSSNSSLHQMTGPLPFVFDTKNTSQPLLPDGSNDKQRQQQRPHRSYNRSQSASPGGSVVHHQPKNDYHSRFDFCSSSRSVKPPPYLRCISVPPEMMMPSSSSSCSSSNLLTCGNSGQPVTDDNTIKTNNNYDNNTSKNSISLSSSCIIRGNFPNNISSNKSTPKALKWIPPQSNSSNRKKHHSLASRLLSKSSSSVLACSSTHPPQSHDKKAFRAFRQKPLLLPSVLRRSLENSDLPSSIVQRQQQQQQHLHAGSTGSLGTTLGEQQQHHELRPLQQMASQPIPVGGGNNSKKCGGSVDVDLNLLKRGVSPESVEGASPKGKGSAGIFVHVSL